MRSWRYSHVVGSRGCSHFPMKSNSSTYTGQYSCSRRVLRANRINGLHQSAWRGSAGDGRQSSTRCWRSMRQYDKPGFDGTRYGR